jgi:hypothetical protein
MKWTPDLARQWCKTAEKLWDGTTGRDLPMFAGLKVAYIELKAEVEKCGDEYSHSVMLQESLGKACVKFQTELNAATAQMQALTTAFRELG